MIKRAKLHLVLIGKDLLIRHDNMNISSIHVWSEEPCLSTLKISVCLNVICYIIHCHSEKASQQKGYIDGATTLLWIPNRKRRTRRIQLMVKKGWFKRDCGSDICNNNINQIINQKLSFDFKGAWSWFRLKISFMIIIV